MRERRLGDESVYFDGYSGETHYLEGLASVIMRQVLASNDVDLDVIGRELAASYPAEGGVAITTEAVRDTVQILRRIGLVRLDDEP